MTVAIVYYIRLAPVYPENNRDHTLVLKSATAKHKNSTNSSGISYELINNWLYSLKNAEAVTGIYDGEDESSFVQLGDNAGEVPAFVKYTDENFFKVFPYHFLAGKPFTKADRVSGIRNAVITDSYARRIFGKSEGAVGKTFSLNFVNTKVVGVVQSGSFLTKTS